MAREGLRVLVVAKKSLAEEQYQDFEVRGLKTFLLLFAALPHLPCHTSSPSPPRAHAALAILLMPFLSTPGSLMSQGLCTCSSLCLELSSHTELCGLLPCFL